MKLPESTAEQEQWPAVAGNRLDDVVEKSSMTSLHPHHHHHHHRLTPDSGVDLTGVGCRYVDMHAFEHSFHGFPSPLQMPATRSSKNCSSTDSESSTYSGCQFSGPTTDGDFRTSSRCTRIHNGHCIVTTRDVLNGDEMVVVEEDGVITTKTHNDRPCVTSV